MAVDVTRVKAQAKSLFDGFTKGQKAMMAVAAVAVIVGLWVVTRPGGETMAPLFSNLSAEDASGITEKLSSQGVSYELADNGRSVLVPASRVYQLRLDMAADGLPTGGAAGYSLLDKQGLTTSQFRQRVDYQRALEGEIARTVQAIDGVQAATVHLVIPDDDVFAGDEKEASASVLVRTRNGVVLDAMQVQTIANLVASSVEGLTTQSVTVADGQGNLLLAPGQDGMNAAMTDAQNRQTTAFESHLATELERLIAPVVGAGKASIKVSADLDFDERESTTTRYENPSPEGQPALVAAAEESTETYTGGGNGTGGVLGVEGTPEEGTTPTDASSYNKSDATRQFALNQVVEGVRTAPGAITRLSVAALVDEGAVTPQQLTAIQEVLARGAGIDEARGDVLTVQALPFDTSAADAARAELEAAERAQRSSDTMALVRTIAVVVIVLVVLLLAWRSMRKAGKRRSNEAQRIDLRELELVRDHLQSIAPTGAVGAAGLSPTDTIALDPVPVPATARTAQQLESEISELIDRQPDEVAALLRNWLGERRAVRR